MVLLREMVKDEVENRMEYLETGKVRQTESTTVLSQIEREYKSDEKNLSQ